MEKLNAPHFNFFRNSEFLQFITNIQSTVDEANQQGEEGLLLDGPLTELNSCLTDMNALFKQERGSEITSDLAAQDDRRDSALAGISLLLQAYLNHYDTPTRQAAERLLNHMNSYGTRLYNESYQSETAIITNLVNDWENDPDLSAAVNTLELTPWVNEMKAANNEFNTLYEARATEATDAPDMTMEQARMEATKAYRKLSNHIEANAVLNPDKPYGDLIKTMNAFIDSYNQTVDNRSGN